MDVQADDGAGVPTPAQSPPPKRRIWALVVALLAVSAAIFLTLGRGPSSGGPAGGTEEVATPRTVTLLGRDGPLASTEVVLFYVRSTSERPVRATMRTDGAGRLTPEADMGKAFLDADGYARAQVTDETGAVAAAGAPADSAHSLQLADARPLKVSVVDAAGNTIAKANVHAVIGQAVSALSDMPPWSAETNEQGEVHIAHLPRAPLELRVAAEGFAESTAVLGAVDQQVRITLDRTGSIAGVVHDPEGAPVDGAVVRLVGSAVWPPIETRTSSSGEYRFEGLASGVYELRAERKPPNTGGPFLVSPPQEGVFLEPLQAKSVDLTLMVGGTLRGHVKALGSKAALEGVDLTLTEAGLSFWPRTTATDAEGRFVFEGLLPTAHSLGVDHPSYVPIRGASVAPGTEVEVFLERGGIVEGRVVDERGFPIEGASLELQTQSALAPPQVYVVRRTEDTVQTSAPSGLAAPSGGRALAALPTQTSTAPRSPDEARAAGPGELGVTLGKVPLVPVAHTTYVPGWSTDATPTPQHTLVSLSATEAELSTDRAGTFRLVRVPAGTHVVQVSHDDYGTALSTPVQVVASQTTDEVSVTLTRGYTLDGRLVDARGYGVAHAQVRVHSEAERFARVVITEGDGTFVSRGLSGTLQVEVRRDGGALLRQMVTPPAPAASGTPTLIERVFRLDERVGELNLRVLDPEGFPVSNALVRLTAKNPKTPEKRTLFSAEDGRVLASGLPAGAFEVRLTKPGFAETVVTLEESGETQDVTLSVSAGVFGHVMSDDGEPAAGASVRLYRDEGPSYEATTDSEGTYRVPAVALGAYRLSLTGERYTAGDIEVTVEAPPASRDAFELPPLTVARAAATEGVLTDRLGTPVPGATVRLDGPADEGARPSAITDARGHFTLRGLAPGNVRLRAEHATAGDATSDVLTLDAGETTAALTLRLDGQLDEASASTTAVAAETAPPPGASAVHGVAIAVVDRNRQIHVTAVAPGSLAQAAGLRIGDVIRQVEGEEVLIAAQARSLLRGPSGTRCALSIERNGRQRQITVTRETHAPL